MNEKIVYILGAGFSYSANIPTQGTLLQKILEYEVGFEAPEFSVAKETLEEFLSEIFPIPHKVDIEDLFTILDRAANEKERFTSYKWDELNKLRNNLIYLILYLINNSLLDVDISQSAYKKFTEHLVNLRTNAGKDIAIISTNWDNLLERFLSAYSNSHEDEKIRTDYCIYTYGINNSDRHIPHITLKAKDYKNIKLLKLHGSINWLYCSQCKRMYVDNESISIEKKECRFCNQQEMYNHVSAGTHEQQAIVSSSQSQKIYIEPIIITPTLLKKYHNLYIQGIWQNAFIELQEATKVVFIGYSLPKIDFELKYLLKKAITKEIPIEVIEKRKQARKFLSTISG